MVDFWDLTFYEIGIAIRGSSLRLRQLNLYLALNAGPIVSVSAKGNPGRDMVRAAQQLIEEAYGD